MQLSQETIGQWSAAAPSPPTPEPMTATSNGPAALNCLYGVPMKRPAMLKMCRPGLGMSIFDKPQNESLWRHDNPARLWGLRRKRDTWPRSR